MDTRHCLSFLTVICSVVINCGYDLENGNRIVNKAREKHEKVAESLGFKNIFSSHSLIAGIVGGKKVSIEKHPYMAAIIIKTCFEGSGIILNSKWILTSSWVVLYNKPQEITVRSGSSWALNKGQIRHADEIFVHPNYTHPFYNNIALIKLSKRLKFSKTTKPIKTGHESPLDDSRVIFSGFGFYDINLHNETFEFDGRLREAKLNVLTSSKCKNYYNESYYEFSGINFCTNATETVSPCLYDYGSPLIWKNKLVGVFSEPDFCKDPNYPSVFTDVTKLRGWIWSTIKDNSNYNELKEWTETEY